jgi:hypothetical protein
MDNLYRFTTTLPQGPPRFALLQFLGLLEQRWFSNYTPRDFQVWLNGLLDAEFLLLAQISLPSHIRKDATRLVDEYIALGRYPFRSRDYRSMRYKRRPFNGGGPPSKIPRSQG